MPIFKSKIQTTSETYTKNRTDMLALVEKLRLLEQRAVDVSSRRNPVFEKREQIPPHERLERLLDPGMPFLRLHTLANYLVEDTNPDTSVPGGSLIAGIGFVNGVRCMLWVDDSGIRAGSMTEMSTPCALSFMDIAKRQKLPIVHLVESAGADLMRFSVESWINAGGLFRDMAELSAMGIPTVTVLHGASTAGGAYMPGMSDYVIGIKNNGMAALAGAALVKAATGEICDDRELGGSEMHASVSGLVEYLAENDAHGLSMARDVVDRFNWNMNGPKLAPPLYEVPKHSADELAGVVGTDYKVPYDVHEVITRIVDGSDFEDFKPRFGSNTVCVQAKIMGYNVGIIGNNGPIDPQGANKASHFYQLCDAANIPLIFLHNTTGFIVGTDSEQAGMIKHGAKMVQGAANIRVPKISLYIGASYGAGNYAMCGMSYKPDFLFAWPNALTNVMAGESAAKTMRQVTALAAERKGKPIPEDVLDAQQEKIIEHFSNQEGAFYNGGRLMNHGVIDPRDTRKVLGFCIETCLEARARGLKPNSHGVARH